MLLIGLNDGSDTAQIFGKSENPFHIKDRGHGAIIFVLLFLLILFVIAVACFVKTKKNEEAKLITFEHASGADSTKTRYKNGVEVKPSE